MFRRTLGQGATAPCERQREGQALRAGMRLAAFVCLAAVAFVGCKLGGGGAGNVSGTANTSANAGANANAGAAPTPAADVGGVEKVKPAPGTGNVQGKVMYNGKPVENIRIKLCEKFNRFLGDCGGQNYAARTDKDGEYVVANVEPKTYEGLLVYIFDTDYYVFATTGIGGLSASKYEVAADKTLFVRPTNLFKGDLKLSNPKAGAKVSAQGLELKWEPYPEAAYYKFSVYPQEATATAPYVNERVEATSFAVDKPLPKGTYRWQVEAYNGNDQKLSESARDIKFTVTDGS
jgi:hypothetical protein